MEEGRAQLIPSEECVTRILSPFWVVGGKLQHTAFKLTTGETYISVNRPAIDTYESDVEKFLSQHPTYYVNVKDGAYQCAKLNVGEIREIKVMMEDTVMDIDVEVEPRSVHTKSHAGIFTRFHNKNIKNGQILKYGPTSEEISADMLLLQVRLQLMKLSAIEQHKIERK